jgi:hypothetical protein
MASELPLHLSKGLCAVMLPGLWLGSQHHKNESCPASGFTSYRKDVRDFFFFLKRGQKSVITSCLKPSDGSPLPEEQLQAWSRDLEDCSSNHSQFSRPHLLWFLHPNPAMSGCDPWVCQTCSHLGALCLALVRLGSPCFPYDCPTFSSLKAGVGEGQGIILYLVPFKSPFRPRPKSWHSLTA